MLFKIGDHIFNIKLAQLECSNGEVHELTPLPFKLLKYLIENNDRLISKRELITSVWETPVSDSSINKVISELRGILGDTAKESKFIATRRKLGYRLVAKIVRLEKFEG